MIRKGTADNILVFPEADYSSESLTKVDGKYAFAHKAIGADMLRYSINFGQNWTDWVNWEPVTEINEQDFLDKELWWPGVHLMAQC